MESALRCMKILSLIPRAPESIETPKILEKLIEAGFAIGERSLQRDMKGLWAIRSELECSEGTKPIRWWWHEDAPPIAAGGFDPLLAVAVSFADRYFSFAMPRVFRKAFAPMARAAHGVLEAMSGTPAAELAKRFRVLPKGPPVRPPEIRPEVMEALTRAMSERRKVAARYSSWRASTRGRRAP